MKKLIIALAVIMCASAADAQFTQSWAKIFAGDASGGDCGYAIAVDKRGNTYVTGSRWSQR
ncbi:MAG: SBBP repeat-containing protein [Fimbriimonadales bacterium]